MHIVNIVKISEIVLNKKTVKLYVYKRVIASVKILKSRVMYAVNNRIFQ